MQVRKEGDIRMAGKIDARLTELGIEVPEAAAPVANTVPPRNSRRLRSCMRPPFDSRDRVRWLMLGREGLPVHERTLRKP